MGMMPQLSGDGIVVVGDAAGFVLNLGYLVRGMDFAIASGEAAARAVIAAKSQGDFSRRGLGIYQKMLKESFVLRDLEFYRRAPEFQENRRLFQTYPKLATGVASRLFTVDGSPPVHLLGTILSEIKESRLGLSKLAIDGWRGATWL
jgi:electron transfer flavoprotein-quinone oxidoreductase